MQDERSNEMYRSFSIIYFESSNPGVKITTQATKEIANRASHFVVRKFLSVDYCRIRKRLALPLPITEALPQSHVIRSFSSPYPWQIWLQWVLEDRILTLGNR